MVKPRKAPRATRGGQASLETTVALIGALLLLFGSLKVWMWVNERLVGRLGVGERSYESTRKEAGSSSSFVGWTEPSKKLSIFK